MFVLVVGRLGPTGEGVFLLESCVLNSGHDVDEDKKCVSDMS